MSWEGAGIGIHYKFVVAEGMVCRTCKVSSALCQIADSRDIRVDRLVWIDTDHSSNSYATSRLTASADKTRAAGLNSVTAWA